MRLLAGVLIATACVSKPSVTVPAPPVTSVDTQPPSQVVPPEPIAATMVVEVLAADTPKTTVAGHTLVAPAGWTFAVRDSVTLLTPPDDPGSHVAFVDVQAKNADQAVALAWAAYNPDRRYPLKLSTPGAAMQGWSQLQSYEYIVSPNDKRMVMVNALHANDAWLVVIFDMGMAVAEKRGGQVGTMFSRLHPKGHSEESFKGKAAHPIDAARLAQLTQFVENAQKAIGVPGVALGIVQNGKVVFAGGFGVRELGKPAKVDADTKFIIASNTKALTTLMLAKLVDEKKLTWETPATSLLPSFKLGDPDTTSRVLVKHLICACTGMPRQDMEWLFEYAGRTPETTMAGLATMQPTSKFGELFQYSNPLAAAAGYIGGRVAFPKLELGKAFDEAMRTRVFAPLGMTSTTSDFKQGRKGNAAVPHAHDIDGKAGVATAAGELNLSVLPVRPAGGAWSTVRDMLKYVQMELAEGALPNGKRYIAKEPLLARRAPQVALSADSSYGMGLIVHTAKDVTVVSHGGDIFGFHSDMMWLPEHGVGAVILTNGDGGDIIRSAFRGKLVEVLFDGRPEADLGVAAAAKQLFDSLAVQRKSITSPASADAAGKLAASYSNPVLGALTVTKAGPVVFDVGEWKSEMASKTNPDGTTSFVTILPGFSGLELVVGAAAGKRTLTLRDAQHEYVFVEN